MSARPALCDSHAGVWGSDHRLSTGDGYLFAADFVQNSKIQERILQRQFDIAASLDVSISKAQIRSSLIVQQGPGPWMLCERCVEFLGLVAGDKAAARREAQAWWHGEPRDGYFPGRYSQPTTAEKIHPPESRAQESQFPQPMELLCPNCAEKFRIGIDSQLVTDDDVMKFFSRGDAAVVHMGIPMRKPDLAQHCTLSETESARNLRKLDAILSDLAKGEDRVWYCDKCKNTNRYPFEAGDTSACRTRG